MPGSGRTSPVLAILGVAFVLLLLIGPASAGAALFAPPAALRHAKPLLGTSTSSQVCVTGSAGANASADPVTGNATAYACAMASAKHPSVNATAEAGFSIPFRVPTRGVYLARVAWSTNITERRGCYNVSLFVVDSAGGAYIGSGGSSQGCFGVVGNGSGLTTEGWRGSLQANHTYFLQAYLQAIATSVWVAGQRVSQSMLVTGTLNRVQLP